MNRNRVEAFSDGVIAILITIMVLELRPPRGTGLADLSQVAPRALSYVLSFVYLAIYWNNHHHLLQAVERVDGKVLWANIHLLFWLSLVPFATAWMGEHRAAPTPVAIYGLVLLLAAVAYFFLTRALLAAHARDSRLARALGADRKGKASIVAYAVAIPLTSAAGIAAWGRWVAVAIYVGVALVWLVPDRRFERALQHRAPGEA